MSEKSSAGASAPGKVDGLLETMTVAEVREFDPRVVVIPVGSTEPHGPHLPYGTDTIIGGGVTAEAVRRANAAGARVLRLPPLPMSNNVNFKGLPFACRISVETLMAVLMDLLQFVREEGVRKVVIVNSHGGNVDTIAALLRQAYDRFQSELFVCACSPGSFSGGKYGELFSDGSPHAGDYETSMVLHLARELVAKGRRKEGLMNAPQLDALGPGGPAWVRPWHRLMPESFAGRPDHSTPEKGAAFFEACAGGMERFLIELAEAPWHPGFPYPPETA